MKQGKQVKCGIIITFILKKEINRAILEEHYGKTLMQIYQKQKLSHTENGSSKLAMESMQQEMISIAESHIQLSQLIRNSVFTPLSTLLNKQKLIKKEVP